jgi:hypothetical protein
MISDQVFLHDKIISGIVDLHDKGKAIYLNLHLFLNFIILFPSSTSCSSEAVRMEDFP